MARRALLLLLLPTMVLCNSFTEETHISSTVSRDSEPDTSKAIRLSRWATQEESARFHSVKGMPKGRILQTLGHPCQLEYKPDGMEVWSYAWGVDWRIVIENGICTFTWSNDGW